MYYKGEKIVYIEYQNGIPHDAITGSTSQGLTYWDFMMFNGEDGYLVYYQSGGGPFSPQDGANYIAEFKGGTYWADKSFKFRKQPTNCRRVRNPHRLFVCGKSTRNPFLAADETNSYEYCKECDCYSSDYCRKHIYVHDDGELRYIEDNSFVD